MTTVGKQTSLRRWLKVRISPSIFLLAVSYMCQQPFILERVPFGLGNWMLFLFSWVAPIVAILASSYQLIRHRSLQHALEIALAIWLLIGALSLVVKAA